MCKDSGKMCVCVCIFQIGEIKKLVNLFPKKSKISQIYTKKHTLQNFESFCQNKDKKIQERKKERSEEKNWLCHIHLVWRSHVVMGSTKAFLSLVE
jgi:hypothetical protein